MFSMEYRADLSPCQALSGGRCNYSLTRGSLTGESNLACRGLTAEIADDQLDEVFSAFSAPSAVKCYSATCPRN